MPHSQAKNRQLVPLKACPLLYLLGLRVWRKLQTKRQSSSCTHASGLPVSQEDYVIPKCSDVLLRSCSVGRVCFCRHTPATRVLRSSACTAIARKKWLQIVDSCTATDAGAGNLIIAHCTTVAFCSKCDTAVLLLVPGVIG